jgi:hypothetical protein
MSSSTENCIANGLTFTIADIDITAPKLNKSGGKSANILYKPTKKGLYINLQVPMLTWGASAFKDPQSGKETYDMAIQFPRKDYSSPDTDTLLAKFIELEQHIKKEAVKNSMAWFNKKTMTPEVIDALWTPMLKYSKDQQTGEADMTKAPTLKIKLPCWDGKFNCEIYDTNGTMLFPDESSGSTPLDLIPKGINIVAIIQCGGLWFANGKFGCTWRLFQSVVQPKPSMKGKCWINVSSETKNALASNERSVVVEDDSDGEPEYVAPVAKPATAQAKPAVPATAVQAKQAPAAKQQVEEEDDDEQAEEPAQAPVKQPEQAPAVQAKQPEQAPAPAVPAPAAAAAPAKKKMIVRKKE